MEMASPLAALLPKPSENSEAFLTWRNLGMPIRKWVFSVICIAEPALASTNVKSYLSLVANQKRILTINLSVSDTGTPLTGMRFSIMVREYRILFSLFTAS